MPAGKASRQLSARSLEGRGRPTAPRPLSGVPLRMFALLTSVAACGAARAQGIGDAAPVLTEREMPYEGGTITLVTYRGKDYRRINIGDLRGHMVKSTALHGLPVCVEGKFDRFVPPNIRLMGSDRELYVGPTLVAGGVMNGQNIWVAGVAEKKRREMSCRLKVHAILRLDDDFSLFKKRFDRYSKAGNSQKLINLGKWIQDNKRLLDSSTMGGRGYEQRRDKAFRKGLSIREKLLDPADADGHYQLAMMHIELCGRAGESRALVLLLRAGAIDHRHKKTAKALRDRDYVHFRNKWVTQEGRDKVLAEEEAARLATRNKREPIGPEPPPKVEPREVPTTDRILGLLAIERDARSGSEGLKKLARRLPDADEAVGRRIVWIFANTGAAGLPEGRRSKSVAVRKDIADALAWNGRRNELNDMIRTEEAAEVRAYAKAALQSLGTPGNRN